MINLSEQTCIELLPWYLNGTLTTDEKQAVELCLENSDALKAELEKLRLLRDNLPEQRATFPAAQLGWRRLQKQIQAEESKSRSFHWSKMIVIAAVLIITVQVGLFSLLKTGDQMPAQPSLLSGSSVATEEGQFVVQLQLSPDASWRDVMKLVKTVHGDIVQGPSALGIVRLRFSHEPLILDGKEVKDVDAVINWFSAQAMVQHVALEK